MKKIISIILLMVVISTMLISCRKHKHQYGEWVTVNEPSCTDIGLSERECDCGAKESKTLPASNHNYVDGICTICDYVNAAPTSNEYFVFTELADGTYSISAKNIKDLPKTVIIPSSYNGKPVTVIAESAFGQRQEYQEEYGMIVVSHSDIETVVIPDGITTIDNEAFNCCLNLSKVIMGDSVTYIGDFAFASCKFKAINLSKSLKHIGRYAFMCAIEQIELPDSLTTIDAFAFYGSGLITITIPESVTQLNGSAFTMCDFLCEIVNNSSVEITDANYSVLEVHKGESKIIDQNGYLFYNHEGKYLLVRYVGDESELVLPSSVNGQTYDINRVAFANRPEITSIVIPEGVKEIGSYAFDMCESLKKVYFPKSLVTINGNTLFPRCESISDVYYAGSADDAMKITIIPPRTHANITYHFEDIFEANVHYNHSYK